MTRVAKSFQRDLPMIETTTVAATSAGSGNDFEQVICQLPDLSRTFLPGNADIGGAADGGLTNKWQALRKATFVSGSTANTNASTTHSYDWRINVWRKGALQGCLAYYPLSVSTTLGSLISANIATTSATAVTGGTTTAIVVGSATNIIAGLGLKLLGTGIDAGKSDYVTVASVSGTTITLSAAPVSSYSATIVVQSATVVTTTTSTIAAGSATPTPTTMNGIVAGMPLLIYGANQQSEVVTVTSVTSTTFTATFAYAHSGATSIASFNGIQQAQIPSVTPGHYTVQPAAITGIVVGHDLAIGSGTTFEIVRVTAINATQGTMTAAFQYSHVASDAVKTVHVPFRPIGFVPSYQANGATSKTLMAAAAAINVVPTTMYGFKVGDNVAIASGAAYETALTAGTVSGTSLPLTPAAAHGGTYNVGLAFATTSATAVTGGTTTAIVVASATGIVAGGTVILQGTGTDSAKTNTCTVASVSGTTVTFTVAIATNSYANTINVTNAAYTTSNTTTVAGKQQVVVLTSATGFTAGNLCLLLDLTGNGQTAAFSGTSEIVALDAISSTNLTISPQNVHTGYYALLPFTATTSSTALTAATATTITLASGTGFNTGCLVYLWGGTGGSTETISITAVTNTSFTVTPTYGHSGAYTLTSAQAVAAANNYQDLVQPFEIRGGDVLTLARLSSDSTGLASPAGYADIEWVPSKIWQ